MTMEPYEIDKGVTLDQLSIWRDADTGNVIFQVPAGREQIVMTVEQWDRAVDFLNSDCSCTTSAAADCPIHDRVAT